MCLAIPARVISLLEKSRAMIDIGGVQKEVSLELLDDVAVGDYVVVHVGYALSRLNEEEAQKTLALFAELDGSQE